MEADTFTGRRVLIAEDSWHVAQSLKMTVEAEGAEVVGPVPTVDRACRLLAETDVDLALVDVNLRDQMAWPLLEALADRGVRSVVLSGYRQNSEDLDYGGMTVAVLGKPVQPQGLIRAMRSAFRSAPLRKTEAETRG